MRAAGNGVDGGPQRRLEAELADGGRMERGDDRPRLRDRRVEVLRRAPRGSSRRRRPAAAPPVAASARRAATRRGVPARGPRRSAPRRRAGRGPSARRATSAARSSEHEGVAEHPAERDRDQEHDRAGPRRRRAANTPRTSTAAAAMNALTNSTGSAGSTESRGIAAPLLAREVRVPADHERDSSRPCSSEVDGHDEQRIGRVVAVEPEAVAEHARTAGRRRAPSKAKISMLLVARVSRTRLYARFSRGRATDADRQGRGGTEQRHRGRLHHEAGRDADAPRRDRHDVRQRPSRRRARRRASRVASPSASDSKRRHDDAARASADASRRADLARAHVAPGRVHLSERASRPAGRRASACRRRGASRSRTGRRRPPRGAAPSRARRGRPGRRGRPRAASMPTPSSLTSSTTDSCLVRDRRRRSRSGRRA